MMKKQKSMRAACTVVHCGSGTILSSSKQSSFSTLSGPDDDKLRFRKVKTKTCLQLFEGGEDEGGGGHHHHGQGEERSSLRIQNKFKHFQFDFYFLWESHLRVFPRLWILCQVPEPLPRPAEERMAKVFLNHLLLKQEMYRKKIER